MTDISALSLQAAKTAVSQAKASQQEVQSAKEFEAVFLSQFVDEMMKTVDMSEAGGGKDTHMWRSFMSEAISKSLVDRGGLGLAGNIQQMMSAYKQS